MVPDPDQFRGFLAVSHSLYRITLLGGFSRQVIPPIRCKDGFIFSIQASEHHYCFPRADKATWTHLEVGFPSQDEPLLSDFRDASDTEASMTDSVFSLVPIRVVLAVMNAHGGFAGFVLPDSKKGLLDGISSPHRHSN